MGYYINTQGNYYEGDQAELGDTPVPQRPDASHEWVNGAWIVQLSTAQAAQITMLYAGYQNAIQQPVSYTSKGGVTNIFQADQNSQDILTKEIAAYQGTCVVPTGYYWVAADNTQVPFTFADLQGLAAAMGAQGWSAFQHLQAQKSAVNAATTLSAVQAVIW